jgi:hypothetical protein
MMTVSAYIGAGLTLGKTWPSSWILIYPSMITLIYLLGACKFKYKSGPWQIPFQLLGGV